MSLTPTPASVEALVSVPRPDRVISDRRNGQVERSTFVVEAVLGVVKLEGDRDYHLVVVDRDTGSTMIAEFVDVTCPGAADSNYWPLMQGAREAFEQACGLPGTGFRDLVGAARITGVGFFDRIHGQRGVAPNGMELHPVIGFEGECQ
ncbi:MAG: hypothetical protein EXR44_02230 [Dehalococcoidia bacterium]|nr:hypothetical protein [Dehalococcoidia bacterium]